MPTAKQASGWPLREENLFPQSRQNRIFDLIFSAADDFIILDGGPMAWLTASGKQRWEGQK
ncbi:MAG: hypothetical protein JJU15_02285 [Pararhodobacter sp.]|nr:hypothetical protein [Pararhodobacter sp.]